MSLFGGRGFEARGCLGGTPVERRREGEREESIRDLEAGLHTTKGGVLNG